jgi:hypothetical protein
VGHRDPRQVLALAERVARIFTDGLGGGGPRGRGSGPRALDAGVHVGLVVIADVEHVVVALEHPGQAAETDVDGPTVATLRDHPHVAAAHRLVCRRDAGCHCGRVAEQRVQPGDPPRGFRVGRREHLEAAGRVDRDKLPVDRGHRRIEGVAGTEGLAAPLTGPVAGGEGVRAVGVGLDRADLQGQQPVAHREGAHLVELHRLARRVLVQDLGTIPWWKPACSTVVSFVVISASLLLRPSERARRPGRGACSRRPGRSGPRLGCGRARARPDRCPGRGTSAAQGSP